MNNNSNKIILNLKNDTQKEDVFFLAVLLANAHISNIKDCLTNIELQAFQYHLSDVFKRIYHYSANWAEKYMEMSMHISTSDDIDGNIYNAIRFGLGTISKQEVLKVCELFEFSQFYLSCVINRGNGNFSFDIKEEYKSIMLQLGIL